MKRRGFTIVELLIVIVVIAILAAITIVAYNGIQQQARVSAVQASVRQAKSQVELLRTSDGYPAIVNTLKAGANVTLQYMKLGDGYCVTGSHENTGVGTYFVTHTSAVSPGPCPVAHWPLDGTADDVSPNDNNGNITGATLAPDRKGGTNGALRTASTKYIDMGDVDYDYNEFSISVWARSDVAAPGHVTNIVGKGDWNTNNNWYIGFRNGTSLAFVYGVGWGVGPSYSVSDFDATAWNHYVGVARSNSLELWLNGHLMNTVNIAHGSVANDFNLQAGRSSYTPSAFGGSVDDVRLYNRALTNSEIQQLYAE